MGRLPPTFRGPRRPRRGNCASFPFPLELFEVAHLFVAVPHAVKDIAQNNDVAAQIKPHQQDNQRAQGAVDKGVAGREADEPGKQGRSGHNGHRRQHRAGEDRRTWLSLGRGHAVHHQHKEEEHTEKEQKAHPLPLPGEGKFL